MLRILPPSASLPSVRSQSACLPPPRFFRGAAFGRTCGTHRHGLRRGVAIESRLVRSVIAIAAVNHFRLTPAFAGPDAEKARRALALSIGIETVVGLCVVFAASLLSSLEPGMHMA